MATPRCSALTRRGTPCHGRPRPGSRFCPFHDPACATALAAGRRKGGSVPNRRPSRRRAAQAGADLLLRLFSAALAAPEPLDTARLEALVDLAPLLLEALDRSSPRACAWRASLAASLAASSESKQ